MHSWQATIQKKWSKLLNYYSFFILSCFNLFYLKINSKYSLEQYISLKLLCCSSVSKYFFWIQRAKITCFRIKNTSELQTEWYLNFSSLLLYKLQDSEKKSTKEKKKKGLGKLRHGESNSFIPLFREPSSIEKIFGEFEREQQIVTFRPPTPPEQPRTPPFVPPRVSSPRAPSPRVASPRVASPRVASPRAVSPRIVHHQKEISRRPEPTLRNHHASATKIQAAYRGYTVSVHLLLLNLIILETVFKGLWCHGTSNKVNMTIWR